jgi:hypothetical protein
LHVLFTSYKQAVFVLIAFSVDFLAGRLSRARQLQDLALLMLSHAFYALRDRWRRCLLLVGATASGHVGAALLARVQTRRGRSAGTRGGSAGAQNTGIMRLSESAIEWAKPGCVVEAAR